MGISEREHHIKVLEQFLHDYQQWGEDLDIEKSINYAISSLRTDLKYDLMYEGEEVYTKANIVAMLEEIKLKITEKSYYDTTIIGNYEDEVRIDLVELDDVNDIIQEKINTLEVEDGEE